MEENKFKFPTEIVELPSKGLIYPASHPLRSGKVEMKYMTAKEEDILSNQSYIQKGVVLDKLLESLTMNKFDIKDLFIGDKNAILVASRVLGYGKDYSFEYKGQSHTVDLSKLENKPFNESLISSNGTISYTLPKTENKIEFKFLNETDEKKINEEIQSYTKLNVEVLPEVTTRLKYQITSVNGESEKSKIKDFVDNYLLAEDSRSLRKYIKEISPDIDMKIKVNINGAEEDIEVPINLNFFWPDL
jgi:hypothetical protein